MLFNLQCQLILLVIVLIKFSIAGRAVTNEIQQNHINNLLLGVRSSTDKSTNQYIGSRVQEPIIKEGSFSVSQTGDHENILNEIDFDYYVRDKIDNSNSIDTTNDITNDLIITGNEYEFEQDPTAAREHNNYGISKRKTTSTSAKSKEKTPSQIPSNNSKSSQSQFDNSLPERFRKDLDQPRRTVVKILHQPQETNQISTNEEGNPGLDESTGNGNIGILASPRSLGIPFEPKKKTELLLLVKGANIHKSKRTALRNYYRNLKENESLSNYRQFLDKYDIKIKFIVGKSAVSSRKAKISYETSATQKTSNSDGWDTSAPSNNQTSSSYLDEQILQESKEFNDIIIGDFEDTYENLVLKSLTGLEWYTQQDKRHRSDYLLLVDDDVEVQVPELLQLVKNKEAEAAQKAESLQRKNKKRGTKDDSGDVKEDVEQDPMLLCPWKNARRARVSRRGPWGVPIKTYPSSYWPSYCGGACYLMNYQAAKDLYESAKKTVAFDVHVEDAFITGVLRQRANLQLESTRPVCVHHASKDSATGKWLEDQKEKRIQPQVM